MLGQCSAAAQGCPNARPRLAHTSVVWVKTVCNDSPLRCLKACRCEVSLALVGWLKISFAAGCDDLSVAMQGRSDSDECNDDGLRGVRCSVLEP